MKKFFPLIVLALGALYLASTLREPKSKTAYNLNEFGRVPVLLNGRIKPLDTVARNAALAIRGNQSIKKPDGSYITPIEWLGDVLFAPAKADTYKTFLIENHEVLDLLKLRTEDGDGGKRFSYEQMRPQLPELDRQARLVENVEQQLRTPFQKQVSLTRERVIKYLMLKTSAQMPDSPDFLSELIQFEKALPAGLEAVRAMGKGEGHSTEAARAMREMADRFTYMEQFGNLHTVPPDSANTDPTAWRTTGGALMESFATGKVHPTVLAYAGLGHSWRNDRAEEFNTITRMLHDKLETRYPEAMRKSDVESRFNAAAPFYSSMNLYVLALLLGLISWLKWPDTLQKSAFWLLALAFVATTVGIATRMWLEGRPPVTNLYSSALGVGWGAVFLCLIIERFYKNAMGAVTGGMIGFATLIIAHHLHLQSGGDTMEMMRAVLDSNFWLATHVVIITIGYSATFLAGFLGLVYIARGVLTKSLDQGTADALYRAVYGITCFAILFNLTGTVLGGIWADQSWGRFWGWDPKENGALIIVLWNAVMLHARWGGMVKQRGFMSMAVFGNIVTSWSWFGTNMLGVGLHSYGFMDAAFYALVTFVASQLLFMGIALIPLEKWASFRHRKVAA